MSLKQSIQMGQGHDGLHYQPSAPPELKSRGDRLGNTRPISIVNLAGGVSLLPCRVRQIKLTVQSMVLMHVNREVLGASPPGEPCLSRGV